MWTVKPEHWVAFKNHAQELVDAPRGKKIKPSSYQRILSTKEPHRLIPHIVREHYNHSDRSKNSHLGGGLHEAVTNVLSSAAQSVGGERVSDWVSPEIEHKKLDDEQKDMAELVLGTYKKDRINQWENYSRIPEYDSRYGSLFVDSHGSFTWAVRGTVDFHDIMKDAKIAFGYTNSSDPDLIESMKKFNEEYPGAKVNVAMHSLGTELGWNAADLVGLDVRRFYAFNPASSPMQPTEHIIKNLDRPNVYFFLNANDLVSKSYLQNMASKYEDEIWMGKFSRSPLASHSLSQWVG